MTVDLVNTYHKDYIVKEYEKLVKEEVQLYEDMISKVTRVQEALPVGSVVNDCAMIMTKGHLDDFVLTFDPN
jgi:hypothetical protein